MSARRLIARDVEGIEIRRRIWMVREARRLLSPAAEAFARQLFG